MNTVTLYPGAISDGASWTSEAQDIGGRKSASGFFSLDITFTGTGTLSATIVCSNGASFVVPENSSAILNGKAAGHYFSSFSLPLCRSFKLVLSATTNTCTVTECILALV